MNRKKLGNTLYYASLIITAVLLLLGLLLFNAKDDSIEEATREYLSKRMITFYAFTVALSSGLIAREVLLGVFNKKKIIIKIAIIVSILIVGTVIMILFKNTTVYNFVLIGGLAGFCYMLIPTVKEEKN